jgi:hypothetical protein
MRIARRLYRRYAIEIDATGDAFYPHDSGVAAENFGPRARCRAHDRAIIPPVLERHRD